MSLDVDQRLVAMEEVERTLNTISGLQVTLKQIDPSTLRTADLPLAVISFGAATRRSANQQISSFAQIANLDIIAYLQSGATATVIENFIKVFASKIDAVANIQARAYTLKLLEIDSGLDPRGKLPSVGFSIEVDIAAQ